MHRIEEGVQGGWVDVLELPWKKEGQQGVMYFDFGVSNVEKYFSIFMFISHLS